MIYTKTAQPKSHMQRFLGAFLAGDQSAFRVMKPKQASKLIYQT